MGIIKSSLAVIFLWPGFALSCPEIFSERLATKAFYEIKDLRKGELDGIKIGWSKDEFVAYLVQNNIATVSMIDDEPFFAKQGCLSELNKISETETIYISGRNMKTLGKIEMIGGIVQNVESFSGFPLDIKSGLSREALLAPLKEILKSDPQKAIYSKLACGNNCFISLKENSTAEQLSSAKGLEFISFDGKARIQAFFKNDVLTRLLYTRQKFKGDGVF